MVEKSYYSISEVAKIVGETQPTLRFWEKEFAQLSPKVSAGGTRRYTPSDIEVIQTIVRLTRDCHMTLDGVRAALSQRVDAELRRTKAINKLKQVRKELLAIRRELGTKEALAEEIIIDNADVKDLDI